MAATNEIQVLLHRGSFCSALEKYGTPSLSQMRYRAARSCVSVQNLRLRSAFSAFSDVECSIAHTNTRTIRTVIQTGCLSSRVSMKEPIGGERTKVQVQFSLWHGSGSLPDALVSTLDLFATLTVSVSLQLTTQKQLFRSFPDSLSTCVS